MDTTPWLSTTQVGWGNTLIDFFAWEFKLLGIQHSTLTKRFYAIRFARIAEGFDDILLRAHRAKSVSKSIKLRGETCKKVPFNTDLLRWIHSALQVAELQGQSLHISSIWAGLLVAFFFCLRVSELLNLTPRDVRFIDEPGGMALSIIIRPSKTDQEKRGATRSLRMNPSVLCPATALFHLRKRYDPEKHPDSRPFPPLLFAQRWFTL